MTDDRVIVIGAGAIGLSCARWLQLDGHRVCVVDPLPPGQACSYGNAGVFAVDGVTPMATPATLLAVPRMLASRRSPLRVVARDLPRLAPWLTAFALRARRAPRAAATASLAALCEQALPAFEPITHASRARALMQPTGWATVFERAETARAAHAEFAAREAHGWPVRWLEGATLFERIGGLTRRVVAAAESTGIWMCTDPARFVEHLADDVRAAGGTFERGRVSRIRPLDGGVRVETAAGSLQASHVVVAAGIHSGRLAARLGDRLGLAAERGYHAMLASAQGGPRMPVMSGEHKFVTTPMAAGVRLAGTSEFARAERAPDRRRFRLLLQRGCHLFPGLETGEATFWMGSRSTTPDSLPVIGRSPACPAVTYACGHQHLGLTLAGITGRLVADDLAGRAPIVATAALRPNRFARPV